MNAPSRVFTFAIVLLGLQAMPALAMDRVSGDPDRHEAERQPPRRGKPAEGQVALPPGTPQAAQQPQVRRDPRPPTFAPSPGVPRERFENRDRRDFRPPPVVRGFDHRPRMERVVPRIPPGYRQYYWAGTPYYQHGDRWYRPYGSSFVIVSAPFGLFVPYLPTYYSTFWFGGTRYFLADDTYYLYDPIRRGYTVTRSPYGNDRDDDDDDEEGGREPATTQELFIYPTNGQSEAQQAEDRYQCHRWAADQVHYDPTESEYRATERAEYDRAMSACLTGRGYSVK
jgi:hypothetical protein